MDVKTDNQGIIVNTFENHVIVKILSGTTDQKAAFYLWKVLPEILKLKLDLIINCDHLMHVNLSRSWFRVLALIEQKMRENGKSLRLILVPQNFKSILSDEGLARVIKVSENIRDALLSLGLVNKKSLDVGFINPFLNATLHVLNIQSQTKAKAGTIFMKASGGELFGDISGVIGLVSESFTGNVIITFPEPTFLNIMSKMMGETYRAITSEIADGASEITNMIFGQAKIVLNEEGYGIKTALPSVICGKGHKFTSGTQGPVVVVPFESDSGDFFVEIGLSDHETQS